MNTLIPIAVAFVLAINIAPFDGQVEPRPFQPELFRHRSASQTQRFEGQDSQFQGECQHRASLVLHEPQRQPIAPNWGLAHHVAPAPTFKAPTSDAELPDPNRADFDSAATEWVDPTELNPTDASEGDAWWGESVRSAMRQDSVVPVSVQLLLVSALQHSAQIRVLGDSPLIRETAIKEAWGDFDWYAFIESQYNGISEPVGSTLTTGGPNRLRDREFFYSFGARRRNVLGGELEIAQRIGLQNNNSVFFIPRNQGSSRLTLGYTQPLLQGAGSVYNTSVIVLAEIESDISHDEFYRELQAHLLDLTRAYWTLYLERGALLQKQRLFDRASRIYKELDRRRDLDTLRSQLVRVSAAVASRQADLTRAETAVRNSESRIRSLVNDPGLGSFLDTELVPQDLPVSFEMPVDIVNSVGIALQNRPEISAATRRIKAAAVRLDMSQNELLPQLNLVLESYVSGLEGANNIGGAFEDSFSQGEPSASIGFQYEFPLGNRAACARFRRRQLELRQLRNQFAVTIETLKMEVEVASREVLASHREMKAKLRAVQAEQSELDYIRDRWKLLPGEDGAANLVLEDLLDAQERLTREEFEFLNTQMEYNLSIMELKRVTGTLLQHEQITAGRATVDCLPTMVLDKATPQVDVFEETTVETPQSISNPVPLPPVAD